MTDHDRPDDTTSDASTRPEAPPEPADDPAGDTAPLRDESDHSLFRPAEPPAYPGYGLGWPGQPGDPGARPPGGTAPAGQHATPGPYAGPPHGGYGPSYGPPRSTPWTAIVVIAAVVGVISGVLAAVGVIIVDRADDPAPSETSQVEPLEEDAAPLPGDNANVTRVADAVLPSVVQIQVRDGARGGTGSGFVLDEDGRIVTNSHVVRAAGEDGQITVVLPDGSRRKADLVGQSESYDLAVVQVDPADLEPARLGTSGRLAVGQQVVAFGSPLGLTSTVTSGIVSALERPVTASGASDNEQSFINAIQTDAAINPGNSGGPLVDLRGRVIGVNSAIATVGGAIGGEAGNIGVGFAIPIDQVRLTVEQIIETGRAVYPVIGVKVDTQAPEAAITEVTPGGPAEDAGLEEGDVIRAIDGEPVLDGIELIVSIRAHVPGDTIEIEFDRDGERDSVQLTLGEQEG